ncbi:MAG: putative Fe-S cluster assembly protein SufT [Gammaproteobacteria bacterium]|nr:putative Fe-S cluster assembly protein SufT [Gammaproteobacteria bacterium]
MQSRIVPVSREIEARLVPTGTPTTIPEGTFVTLTQTLGGAYTVVFEGNMARVEGEDGDALGLDPVALEFDPPADGKPSMAQVEEALASVYDPEIPVNIVELGLIYGCEIVAGGGPGSGAQGREHAVHIDLTLTAPGCGMGPVLVQDVERRVAQVPFVSDVVVRLVFDPPWSRDMMTEEAQLALGIF